MFSLAHFSDPHLAGWSVANPRLLLNKRITGYLSWRFKRSKIHLASVLEHMIEDIKALAPDHVAITGDIVNISLPGEFEGATQWLHRWAEPERVSIIPGNHDAYVAVSQANGLGLWGSYMTTIGWEESGAAAPTGDVRFPFVRVLGEVALVGVSSAVPTAPFIAAGRVGEPQMRALRKVLMSLRRTGLFRVVLIHHPPYAGAASRRKSLLDAPSFMETVAECGAELVLHGHTHIAGLGRIGDVPVIGVPSASAIRTDHKDAAAYNIYRIARDGPNWQLTVDIREISEDNQRFEPAGSYALTIPSPLHS